MGGHYSGTIPTEARLQVVDVRELGGHLTGVSRGRLIGLNKFDRENRNPGYVGVWQKVLLPELPPV